MQRRPSPKFFFEQAAWDPTEWKANALEVLAPFRTGVVHGGLVRLFPASFPNGPPCPLVHVLEHDVESCRACSCP